MPRRLGKGGGPPFAIPRSVPVRSRVVQAITCGHNNVAPSCLPARIWAWTNLGMDKRCVVRTRRPTRLAGGGPRPSRLHPLPSPAWAGRETRPATGPGAIPPSQSEKGALTGFAQEQIPVRPGRPRHPLSGTAAPRTGIRSRANSMSATFRILLRGRTDSAIARNRAGKAVERRKRFPACSSFPDRQRVSVALGTARGGKFSGRRQRASA